jgi:hypothetical protein
MRHHMIYNSLVQATRPTEYRPLLELQQIMAKVRGQVFDAFGHARPPIHAGTATRLWRFFLGLLFHHCVPGADLWGGIGDEAVSTVLCVRQECELLQMWIVERGRMVYRQPYQMGTDGTFGPLTRKCRPKRLDDLARRARLSTLDKQILNCEPAGNRWHSFSKYLSLLQP